MSMCLPSDLRIKGACPSLVVAALLDSQRAEVSRSLGSRLVATRRDAHSMCRKLRSGPATQDYLGAALAGKQGRGAECHCAHSLLHHRRKRRGPTHHCDRHSSVRVEGVFTCLRPHWDCRRRRCNRADGTTRGATFATRGPRRRPPRPSTAACGAGRHSSSMACPGSEGSSSNTWGSRHVASVGADCRRCKSHVGRSCTVRRCVRSERLHTAFSRHRIYCGDFVAIV